MNKIVSIVAILAILFLAGILIFGGDEDQATENGKVYIGVTDVAADMENVSEITMTGGNVELHSQTNGWVSANADNESFNLLKLNSDGQTQLWAEVSVPAGDYNQARFSIENVEITAADGTTTQAILPSESVIVESVVNVRADADASVVFDVQGSQSLHIADNGAYVFAPVVVTESRNGVEASVDSNNILTINGGVISSETTTGVDLSGESRANFSVSPNTTIEVSANDIIITSDDSSSSSATTSDDTDAEAGVEADADVDVNTSTDNTETEAGVDVEGEVEVQY